MKNQNGLSLLEVIISIAFFSALVLAGAGWMNLLSQESIASNDNIAIANAMNRVRYAFGDDDRYCKKIVGTMPDGSARAFDLASSVGSALVAIDYYNIDNNTKTGNVMTAAQALEKSNGAISGGVKVRSIVLRPVSKTAGNSGVANLEFTFAKSNGSEVRRWFPVYVTVAGGVIDSCSTMASTDLVVSKKCEIVGGGYTQYDSADDSCKANEEVSEWQYTNDTTTATCAPGTHPAASLDDPNPELTVCRAEAEFVDSLPPRAYGGVVDESPDSGWRVTWDKTTSSCKFQYVIGATPKVGKNGIRCSRAVAGGQQ